MTSEEQEEPALRAGKSSSPVSKLMGVGGTKLRGKEIQRKQYVVRGRGTAESRDGKTGQGRSRRVVLNVSWATRVKRLLLRQGTGLVPAASHTKAPGLHSPGGAPHSSGPQPPGDIQELHISGRNCEVNGIPGPRPQVELWATYNTWRRFFRISCH